jgi:phage repressor protein C with HTH and peptisase S24 domain
MLVAEAFGVTLDDFYSGRLDVMSSSIPVVGKVGAGASVDLFDAHKENGEGHYRVACPPQLSPKGIVAVEVVGDSMAPIYLPGAVLFYSRDSLGVPSEAIGRICICEDSTGKAWVKQIRHGRDEGTFTLVSMNPDYDHRHGVSLKWAAPVRFALPPEFVKRLG